MDMLTQRAIAIRMFLLDVDGVLTDGKLYFSNHGDELKAFNIQDGLGIKFLQRSGIAVGIVTGKRSHLVANRARDLGIEIVVQGREDKLVAIQEIISHHNIQLSEVAYMGDDLPDMSAISAVGLGMTVANGVKEVKKSAHWISQYHGGNGAVREACELILNAQGKWEHLLQDYRN
jgi:3-deoxy-D-manno-octulosonate 8-phosphate phosphatase (KDO 8-P phosphatase)